MRRLALALAVSLLCVLPAAATESLSISNGVVSCDISSPQGKMILEGDSRLTFEPAFGAPVHYKLEYRSRAMPARFIPGSSSTYKKSFLVQGVTVHAECQSVYQGSGRCTAMKSLGNGTFGASCKGCAFVGGMLKCSSGQVHVMQLD